VKLTTPCNSPISRELGTMHKNMMITTLLVVLASFLQCVDSVGDAYSNLIIYSSPPDAQSIQQDINGFNVNVLNGTSKCPRLCVYLLHTATATALTRT